MPKVPAKKTTKEKLGHNEGKLLLAATSGDVKGLRALLADEARFAPGRARVTPFHQAVALGHLPVLEVLCIHDKGNINTPDRSGETPLVKAVRKQSVGLTGCLLKAGADVTAETESGLALLALALNSCSHKELLPMCRLLLKHMADPNVDMGEGQTPLHYAAKMGNYHLAALLLEEGADPFAKDKRGKTPLEVAIIVGAKPVQDILEGCKKVPKAVPKDPLLVRAEDSIQRGRDADARRKVNLKGLKHDGLLRRLSRHLMPHPGQRRAGEGSTGILVERSAPKSALVFSDGERARKRTRSRDAASSKDKRSKTVLGHD